MLRNEPPNFGDMTAAEQADECETMAAILDLCTSRDGRLPLAAAFYRRLAAEIRADAGFPVPV